MSGKPTDAENITLKQQWKYHSASFNEIKQMEAGNRCQNKNDAVQQLHILSQPVMPTPHLSE